MREFVKASDYRQTAMSHVVRNQAHGVVLICFGVYQKTSGRLQSLEIV